MPLYVAWNCLDRWIQLYWDLCLRFLFFIWKHKNVVFSLNYVWNALQSYDLLFALLWKSQIFYQCFFFSSIARIQSLTLTFICAGICIYSTVFLKIGPSVSVMEAETPTKNVEKTLKPKTKYVIDVFFANISMTMNKNNCHLLTNKHHQSFPFSFSIFGFHFNFPNSSCMPSYIIAFITI